MISSLRYFVVFLLALTLGAVHASAQAPKSGDYYEDDVTGALMMKRRVPADLDRAGLERCRGDLERRLNRLLNPALSAGLPAFLTKGAGMFSGLMLSQYTADMLIVEQKILSTPAYHQSIPAAADQEDFVSMGMNTAIKNGQILDNAYGVLGIELMAAAQALDLRDFTPGKGCSTAKYQNMICSSSGMLRKVSM